jgi:poly-beta-1,6-N-acetyl-D-glucosamine synthase
MMLVFWILVLSVLSVYVAMLLRYSLAWMMYPTTVVLPVAPSDIGVTVIIATRNEAKNIITCLESLKNQTTQNPVEVLVSDDFSEDDTVDLVIRFRQKLSPEKFILRLISPGPGDSPGKKAALERAIRAAKGELIVSTDADCVFHNGWLASILSSYYQGKPHMITGLVAVNNPSGFFQKLQALDIFSQSVTGACSVMINRPLLCHGANLAFTKSAFDEFGGYGYRREQHSGDDVYLMLQIAKSQTSRIHFNKSVNGVVFTNPARTFTELFNQRVRWVSKIKHYRENYIILIGILILFANFIFPVSLLLATFSQISFSLVAMLFLVKATADLILMMGPLIISQQQKLLWLFLPLQLIYPFYLLSGLIISVGTVGYHWKGRKGV